MIPDEKSLFDRIFNPVPVLSTADEAESTSESVEGKEASSEVQPIPLKSVEQLLREANNPPIKQTG